MSLYLLLLLRIIYIVTACHVAGTIWCNENDVWDSKQKPGEDFYEVAEAKTAILIRRNIPWLPRVLWDVQGTRPTAGMWLQKREVPGSFPPTPTPKIPSLDPDYPASAREPSFILNLPLCQSVVRFLSVLNDSHILLFPARFLWNFCALLLKSIKLK